MLQKHTIQKVTRYLETAVVMVLWKTEYQDVSKYPKLA